MCTRDDNLPAFAGFWLSAWLLYRRRLSLDLVTTPVGYGDEDENVVMEVNHTICAVCTSLFGKRVSHHIYSLSFSRRTYVVPSTQYIYVILHSIILIRFNIIHWMLVFPIGICSSLVFVFRTDAIASAFHFQFSFYECLSYYSIFSSPDRGLGAAWRKTWLCVRRSKHNWTQYGIYSKNENAARVEATTEECMRPSHNTTKIIINFNWAKRK